MNEQTKIAKEYLELAKIDLVASSNLYEKEIYNISIFELQQAVEKVVKSFCLAIKINGEYAFSLNDLKGKEGHNSLKFLIEMIERYLKYLQESSPDNIDNSLKTKVINLLKERKEAISLITGRENKEEILKEFGEIISISDISFEQFKLTLPQLDINCNEEEAKKKFKFFKESLDKNELLNQVNKFILPLVLLGAVTLRHESSSRYPFNYIEDNGNVVYYNIKPEEYKLGLGVIDSFKKLEESLNIVINNLEIELK